MIKFLIKWFVNIIALSVVIHLVAGVSVDNVETVLVAALILGLLNAFIRPFILIITLPITVLTFGFFTLIINGFLFYLAARFVPGFTVAGFWNAFWAALLFSVISSLLNFLLTPKIPIRYDFFGRKDDDDDHTGKGDFIDVDGKVE